MIWSVKSFESTITFTLVASSLITARQLFTPFALTSVSILFSVDIMSEIDAILSAAAICALSVSFVESTIFCNFSRLSSLAVCLSTLAEEKYAFSLAICVVASTYVASPKILSLSLETALILAEISLFYQYQLPATPTPRRSKKQQAAIRVFLVFLFLICSSVRIGFSFFFFSLFFCLFSFFKIITL